MSRYVFLLAVLPAWAPAQTSLGTSSVSGQVRDSSGLVVPGAAVELADAQRGSARRTVSNDTGQFHFPGMQTGLYTLKVSKTGFETYTYSNFQVQVNQSVNLDATLKPGAVTETVTINAAGETQLLETSSNSLGTVVDNSRVTELPLNGRNFLQLAVITGGTAVPVGNSDRAGSQTGHGARAIHIGGNLESVTSYLINGIVSRGSRLGEASLNVSVAAIDQFKMQMSYFMPDQGPNPGIVNVITKSGTNRLHGELFEFVRNKSFDARNYYAPGPEPLHRNQYGFALGGPVVRDKLWFHAHQEGLRQILRFSQRAFTPSAAMFGGNFAEVPQPIFDPFTFNSATGLRQAFAGNRIPETQIHAVSKRLLPYYRPGSSYAQRPQNLFANPANRLDDDQFSLKVDGALSRHNLSASFFWEDSPAVVEAIMPLAGATYPYNSQIAALQHTFTIGPSLVNIARVGFSRATVFNRGEGFSGGEILDQIGIPGTLDKRGITGITIQGFAGFGRSGGPLGNADNTYQVDEALSYSRGKHSYQFGVGIRYNRTKQQNANANALGSLSFQTVFSAQLARNAAGQLAPQANTGNAFADFLLGVPTSGQVIGLDPFYYRYTQWFPYLQDSWRVSRTLTLNYGLSWFYSNPPDPRGSGRAVPHIFEFSTGLLKYAALGEIDPRVFRPDRNNWTPRFGAAWQPARLKNTVIRAGVGAYYEDTALIEAQFSMVAPPFQNAVSFLNPQTDPLPTYLLGKNVFPLIPLPALTKDFAANLPPGFSPFGANPDSRIPYVIQWNLSVQRGFGRSDVVQIDYLGTSAHRQQNRYDIDQCIASAAGRCDPAARPYPRYNSILYADNNGNLNYEALIAKHQHQFAGGFSLLTNYTFSKTLTEGWEGGGGTQSQYNRCRACDRGPVSYHTPHRVVTSALWQVPVGRKRRFGSHLPLAADLVAGGWNLNGILTFSTGQTFTVTAPNRTGSNNSAVRANRLCDGRDDSLAGNLRNNGGTYFQTACFQPAAPNFFGSGGRGILLAPGIHNWDAGIDKSFPLTERGKLEFRGEFFNLWNHTQFNQPAADSGDPVNFGRVASARAPRLVQLGVRLVW
ncbi:MAG: carboxypeptidase regulatory-like domain-containing protein [Acidobacteria bacterium]|nr:carboxypeptidase regulatory-like domain-containing protein [Acidobacteriota bacterium]MBI3470408.1 carboxypeptidase regulatory-like domain-containing protein [Candidatus Solibacter usitatus]